MGIINKFVVFVTDTAASLKLMTRTHGNSCPTTVWLYLLRFHKIVVSIYYHICYLLVFLHYANYTKICTNYRIILIKLTATVTVKHVRI